MIYHPALAYFAADYHLEQYTVELEGKSPSPAQMKRIIDFARAENIRTIFIQSQFETARAEAIAREIEAKVEAIDPLAYNWLEEMYSLGDKLQKALNE
jgi:zinc transport system substrate-binding protein